MKPGDLPGSLVGQTVKNQDDSKRFAIAFAKSVA